MIYIQDFFHSLANLCSFDFSYSLFTVDERPRLDSTIAKRHFVTSKVKEFLFHLFHPFLSRSSILFPSFLPSFLLFPHFCFFPNFAQTPRIASLFNFLPPFFIPFLISLWFHLNSLEKREISWGMWNDTLNFLYFTLY